MLPRRACPCPPAQMNPPKDEQARSEDDEEQQSNDALQILGQFERLYESRVAEVEADPRITDPQRNEIKLKIMTDWVKDLGEQNAMLVQTVHDLEQAAVCRVKLLENKLQATSNLISHNMSNSEKSEEDLNALTNRICHLTRDQNNMQKRIDCLQSDINNLLELIKRGRTENDWNLDRFKFYEIQPSDIPTLPDCTCNQITNVIDNEDNACEKSELQIKKLSEQLHNTEAKMEKRLHEYKCKERELEIQILNMQKESENLKLHVACLEKDSLESREAFSCEVAQKQDAVLSLKRKLKCLEDQLCDSKQKLQCRDEVIYQLKEDLERNNEKDDKIRCLQEQLDELKSKLPSKNCVKLQDNKVATTKRVSISTDSSEKIESLSKDVSIENQHEILAYLMNLKSSMEKDKEIIYNLKLEYETVLKSLRQTKNIYEQDVALVNEKLQDMKTCLCNYRSEVIEQDCTKDSITEFISTIEKKLVFIEKLFQNNCQKCVKENVQSEIKDIISKVISGTQKLSEIHENKCKITSSIQSMVSKSKPQCKQNINEEEQKAILEAICQQFRMMEEFRICTVEVQAATEDLREEVSEVICNLNSRHCKYVELNEMVNQLQDYLTKTKENMSEVINHLELQEEQRTRHSERITNNRIRLKDIKNEFNRTQSELSKCLNNVQNNIQNTNLLSYAEIHTCNDLIISVAEEVEELVNNIHNFQFQGCETLSSMTEVKHQLTTAETKVKELKRKSEKILQENETAQKSFVEKFERLGKYECEVDNCHSKMQDVLESIISIRDQLNEFGCIQENENCYESTNDTIKLKEELRKSYKECEELKLKICQEPQKVDNEKNLLEWENKVIDLQDQIQILKNEIKCKEQTNTFLKGSIDSLEKELLSIRAKAEDNRRCSSTECFELKKKIFELENLLRVQKDVENNLKCLVNNETDSKKSQLLDYAKDRHYDSSLGHGLSGVNKNISQLFKGLQETIQTTNNGIQEVTDNLKRLVPEGLSHSCCNSDNAIQAATESLAAYVESIKYCSIEVEKIKAALHSKNKLMENMDEIIRIQKDSITISQSEMEDVHKTLQEKIDVQEKTIDHLEKERSRLMQQNEFQVQTIGHLREAVVEAKKSIDQLTNKAASDNLSKCQIVKSLRMYLAESQSQYNECYGEASEQSALLELQRDAISELRKRISHLECDEFVQAFILHFIYYVILFKYQEELNFKNEKYSALMCKIQDLECAKTNAEKQRDNYQCKFQEASKEIEKLWCRFEESRQKICAQKQSEIDALLSENDDLRQQLEAYKIDFNIIEEEMKKMGMVDNSVESFKIEIDTLRSENEQSKCTVENYRKTIVELKTNNEYLAKTLQEYQTCADNDIQKYKEQIMKFQCEFRWQNEEIKQLKIELLKNEEMINKLVHRIDDLKAELRETERRLLSCQSDLESSKQTNCALKNHIDTLKMFQDKFDLIEKLEKDNYDLKNEHCIMKSNMALYDEKTKNEMSLLKFRLKQTQCELLDVQKNHNKALQDLNKNRSYLNKLMSERRAIDTCSHPNSACQAGSSRDQSSASRPCEAEELRRLTKQLEECHKTIQSKSSAYSELQTKYNAMSNKCDSFERSCQRQKDEIMLLEKKLGCMSQKFQNCKEKNEELIRQNKTFEDHNSKCMAELEDITLQLEDMQSSLVEMRAKCDAKSQSLDCVSAELARMKVSRSEVCEESSHVLNWLRRWMREQKQAAASLQERLLRLSSKKKNFINEMKRLKRRNRVLAKRLKYVSRPTGKRAVAIVPDCSLPLSPAPKSQVKHRNGFRNGFHSYSPGKESSAVYSYFKRECREGANRIVDKITTQGDYRLFRTLEHLIKQVPRASQINDRNVRNERIVHEDSADYGYQTSSSK